MSLPPTQQSHPQGEVIPPAPGYVPPQPRRRVVREHSVWDPRSAPGTYFLLAVNIAVFLWMVAHGVNAKLPSEDALIHYGANSTLLVLHGQWYRLLTATFVHVGLLHLAANMWCLWNLGILGEPLLGPLGMVAVYTLTGIAGNLLSMATNVIAFNWWRNPWYLYTPGAGASGAVFGIAGILIVLLSNRRLPFPWAELRRLRSSVVKFALINLAIGLSTMFVNVGIRIDNSAHIGGCLSGLALGVPLVPRMTAGRDRYLKRQKATFAAASLILALFGYYIAYLL
ncbi:MAG TPA: rhomboid family intramembrane serine protease [Acidobacteriaceae bacterium]|jgi:rhomboid protease GluP|nr:rhomboid family intramembrane serine protease [Acidobacteriaceae bacterium]